MLTTVGRRPVCTARMCNSYHSTVNQIPPPNMVFVFVASLFHQYRMRCFISECRFNTSRSVPVFSFCFGLIYLLCSGGALSPVCYTYYITYLQYISLFWWRAYMGARFIVPCRSPHDHVLVSGPMRGVCVHATEIESEREGEVGRMECVLLHRNTGISTTIAFFIAFTLSHEMWLGLFFFLLLSGNLLACILHTQHNGDDMPAGKRSRLLWFMHCSIVIGCNRHMLNRIVLLLLLAAVYAAAGGPSPFCLLSYERWSLWLKAKSGQDAVTAYLPMRPVFVWHSIPLHTFFWASP